MIKWVKGLLLLVSMTLLCACSQGSEALPIVKTPLKRSESLLHTVVQLSIYHDNQEEVMEEAITYIKEMEALLSTNLASSDVYRINANAGQEVVVDARTYRVIDKALELAETSHGRFDISIGAVSQLWKIGDRQAQVPDPALLEQAVAHVDYRKIVLNPDKQSVKIEEGMALELGAISKGFIADDIRQLFERHGITTAIINLGGNVVVMGSSPTYTDGWHVGVQDPDQVRGQTVGKVATSNQSVVTSGIYERFLEVDGHIYHHILDPKTGYPVDNHISGVTVFSKGSMEGDGLSTTLFVLGLEEGLELVNNIPGVEAVFIDKEQTVYLSDGLLNTFELTNKEYHLAKDN